MLVLFFLRVFPSSQPHYSQCHHSYLPRDRQIRAQPLRPTTLCRFHSLFLSCLAHLIAPLQARLTLPLIHGHAPSATSPVGCSINGVDEEKNSYRSFVIVECQGLYIQRELPRLPVIDTDGVCERQSHHVSDKQLMLDVSAVACRKAWFLKGKRFSRLTRNSSSTSIWRGLPVLRRSMEVG